MGKDLIGIVIIFAGVILYCKALDRLGLKEKTKRIAMVVFLAIVDICGAFYIIASASGKGYFVPCILILWFSIGLASAGLKIWNKEQLAKKLHKLFYIGYWGIFAFVIIRAIL